jgi:hypothetical protein
MFASLSRFIAVFYLAAWDSMVTAKVSEIITYFDDLVIVE